MSNTIDQDIANCGAAIAATCDNFLSVGKTLACACDRHDGFIDILHKTLRGSVSVSYLRRLERCGRGELIPELVVCVGPAQAWLEKLSIQDQKKAIAGVPWPVGGDDTDTRIKLISDMTYHEAKAVFSGGVIAATSTVRVRALEIERGYEEASYAYAKKLADIDKDDRKIRAKIAKIGIVVYPTYIIWNGVKLTEDDICFLGQEIDRMKK